MIRLDDEPAKRLRDWLEDDEDTDDEDADRSPDENDEETTSEFVQRIVREYSRLGTGSNRSDK